MRFFFRSQTSRKPDSITRELLRITSLLERPNRQWWRKFRQVWCFAHGLRNEITALQESASSAGLFTPLIWWQ